MARLLLDGITHRYQIGGPDVLRDVHLEIANGEAHALLGPSGSGKSTLLSILSGLLTPSSGRVCLNEQDVTRTSPEMRNIAQVFQFPVLYPAMTVAENLAFPLKNRGEPSADIRARVRRVADALQLTQLLGHKGDRLNTHDKQKVALGRALVRRDVGAILLDEPLTAVEASQKWHLRRVLRDVQREFGITMIYVTHDQLEALTFADRVTVINDGELLQTASPEALMRDPSHTFVGRFVGHPGMNVLPGWLADGQLYLSFTAGSPASPNGLAHTPAESITRIALPGPPLPLAESGPCEIGVRPEGIRLSDAADNTGIVMTVERSELAGTDAGTAIGLLHGRIHGVPISLRAPLPAQVLSGRAIPRHRMPRHRMPRRDTQQRDTQQPDTPRKTDPTSVNVQFDPDHVLLFRNGRRLAAPT